MTVALGGPGMAAARSALDHAIAAHYDDLLRALRRRGSEPWQAAEVVHDLYLRLSGDPEALAGKASPRAFLIRAAVNLGIDRARRRGFESRLFAMLDARSEELHAAAEDGEAAEAAIDAPRRLAVLRRAILELPPQRRAAFVAWRVGGMAKDEIAAKLGVTRGMVNRHLRKATAHCIARIEEEAAG